jgi:hypothetical protein
MLMRWITRPRRRRVEFPSQAIERDAGLKAVVVEKLYIDGKPTYLHVAYLAGITASAIAASAAGHSFAIGRCVRFWEQVADRLDALGERLSPEDRERIEAKIAERVPRASEQERTEVARRHREALGAARAFVR